MMHLDLACLQPPEKGTFEARPKASPKLTAKFAKVRFRQLRPNDAIAT